MVTLRPGILGQLNIPQHACYRGHRAMSGEALQPWRCPSLVDFSAVGPGTSCALSTWVIVDESMHCQRPYTASGSIQNVPRQGVSIS